MAAEPQLVDYIQKARGMGQDDQQTRALLSQNGWTEPEINEAFSAMVMQQPVVTQPQPVVQPIITQPQVQPQIQPQVQPQIQTQQPIQPQIQPQQTQYRPQPQAQPQYQNVGQNMMPIESRNSHTALKLSIVLIILIIIAIGGYFALGQPNLLSLVSNFQTTSRPTPTITTTPIAITSPTPTAFAFVKPNFAQYNLSTTSYTPTLPTYQISLSELANLSNFQTAQGAFSTTQQNALTTDNFFVAKNGDKSSKGDDWTYLYGRIGGATDPSQRKPENSVFITTDFLTHAYTKLINNEFSNLEENNFYPTLDSLSKSLLSASATAYGNTTVQEQKDSYDRLSAYFLVTSSILDNALADYQKFQQSGNVSDSKSDTKSSVVATADSLAQSNGVSDNAKGIAEQEIGLIFDASTTASSPLMGSLQNNSQEDYTQFAPTGHYTQNVIFRDYFRAMSFYGNMNFLLNSPQLTRDAANISQLLTSNQLKQWASIYQPTSFFAGQGDDLSVYEYNDATNVVGFNSTTNDDATLTKLQTQLATYENPQVASYSTSQNPPTGFTFMGKMVSPDLFVFSSLTQSNGQTDATTGQILPTMPTGIIIPTIMGSKASNTLLNAWITNNNSSSDKVLGNGISTLQTYLNNAPPQRWTQSAYWSLVYTMKSLFTDNINKSGYPNFIQSTDWDTKNIETFLGSWTDLKHGTSTSQSKASNNTTTTSQSTATSTTPKGYVEPNVDFLDRLIALVNMTNDGLNKYNLESPDFQSKVSTFENDLTFYKTIAVSELQNQNISDSDFEKLRLSAGQLDSALQPSTRSAIISSIFTDTTKNKNLYEADGVPNYIYVAVKDANGTRLTKGLVYSYYEFTGSSKTTYTDSTWQGWEYSSVPQKLQMPWWTKSLIP